MFAPAAQMMLGVLRRTLPRETPQAIADQPRQVHHPQGSDNYQELADSRPCWRWWHESDLFQLNANIPAFLDNWRSLVLGVAFLLIYIFYRLSGRPGP